MKPSQPDALRVVIAHRGVPSHYPENSLAGFKAALNLGMLYPKAHLFVEVDVRTSQDQVSVAHHDDSIQRTLKGKGRCVDYTHAQLARLVHRHEHDPLDFAAMRKGSDAPLFDIRPRHGDDSGDYHTPTIRTLLELTREANRYCGAHGSPIGICLDLKHAPSLPVLAATLNQFAADHPGEKLPIMTLGIRLFVRGDKHAQLLLQQLTPEALECFDMTPELRPAQLLTNLSADMVGKVRTAFIAALVNGTSPWQISGDMDPTPGRDAPCPITADRGDAMGAIAMNFHMCDTVRDILGAWRRQSIVLTHNPQLALQLAEQLQEKHHGGQQR